MVTRFLTTAGVRLLEAIFFFGIAGSALVVILTGIEDIREMFQKEVPPRDGME